jgi:hypothetical protein
VSKPGKSKNNRFFNKRTLIGVAISIVGLYLGFRKFDAAEFANSLKEANLMIYLIAMMIQVFMVLIRAWRWKYIVLPLADPPIKNLFAADMICYFGNNVFPLRLGEVLRSYSLGKMTGISSVSIFGTVVLERILDSLTFLVILILASILFRGMPGWVRIFGYIAIAIIIAAIVLYSVSKRKNVSISKFLKSKFKVFSKVKVAEVLDKFIDGISTLEHTSYFWILVFQSAVIWIVGIFDMWLVGVSLNVYFSIEELLLIFFVASAIISVPSAPGYVGTYHAGVIGILIYLGFNRSLAQVSAVLLHAVGFISLTLIGLIYFVRYHIGVKEPELLEIEKRKEKEGLEVI